jgi:type II secretory pathway pseudopilin PulG
MKRLSKKQVRQPVRVSSIRRQAGVTLMETMIALALSVVVTSAMVILMGNSLGTATRVIHMSQLTDELRNALSMMTRDVRRANYSAHSLFCYGNSECGAEDGPSPQAGDIQLTELDANSWCFTFTLDRGSDGNAANDPVGGFRRVTTDGSADGIGVIEMWTGDEESTPDCASDAGDEDWVALTDPSTVDVTFLRVLDDGSFTKVVDEGEGETFDSIQREIEIRIAGQLVREDARNASLRVRREVWDTIYVRNDFIAL